MSELVHILCHPTASFEHGDEPARDRISSAWIVSCLFQYGGHAISDALASSQHTYIQQLSRVLIDSKAGTLDAAHVQCILDILRYQLQSHPRHTVTALPLREAFIPSLVKHIALQPVVEFLPRLVGTRAFPARGLSTAVLPAHKKALAMLMSTKVVDKLADTYIKASTDLIDNVSSSSTDGFGTTGTTISSSSSSVPINNNNNQVMTNKDVTRDSIAASCEAMGEIAARASALYLKEEEPDERTDGVYSSGLGIVTAAVYNDAKKYLDPYYNPTSYLRVIQKVISDVDFLIDDDGGCITSTKDHEKESLVLLPPLQMLNLILRAWRETDPAHRMTLSTKERPVASVLGHALGPLWPGICRLLSLSSNDNKPCAFHLAVIDLLCNAAAVFGDKTSREYLYSEDVVKMIVDAVETFKQNDLFVTSSCRFLSSLIEHRVDVPEFKKKLNMIIHLTNHTLKDNFTGSPVVPALEQMSMDEIRTINDEDQHEQQQQQEDDKNEWEEWCQVAKSQRLGGPALRRRKSESELAIAGEDLTHELYVFTHINEAKAEHTLPPTDDFIADAVDAGVTHRGRARLTAMLHL